MNRIIHVIKPPHHLEILQKIRVNDHEILVRLCSLPPQHADVRCVFLQSYDNGDSQLDSSELLKFIQHNESVVELQSYADQESNKLLRSVCLSMCVLK